MKPTNIKMELTDPQLLNPILDRAPKKEAPAILVKTIKDIDKEGWRDGSEVKILIKID